MRVVVSFVNIADSHPLDLLQVEGQILPDGGYEHGVWWEIDTKPQEAQRSKHLVHRPVRQAATSPGYVSTYCSAVYERNREA